MTSSTGSRHARPAIVIAVGLLMAAALLTPPCAGPAAAHEPYTEKDANYLNIIDTFVYPIGVILEWTVTRPIHMLESRSARGAAQGRSAQVGTMRVKRGCNSLRPPRYCSRD